MAHRNLVASENLDVPDTSHDSVPQAAKGSAGDLTPEPLLSVVSPHAAQGEDQRRRYRPHGSKHLSLDQATNIVEAVDHARAIGLPLVAHATIHWSGTVAFDDPSGKLFAKVREGLHKWLLRRSIAGGLTCVWCRGCKAHTDIVHCHLLFHLSVEYRTGARFLQTEAALYRLVGRHGDGVLGEFAVKIIVHPDPDGLYLIKAGDRKVWDHFNIKKEWRKSQGIIHGKRCGTTENIGRAARNSWHLRLLTERGVA
jgi:hypothetical protein